MSEPLNAQNRQLWKVASTAARLVIAIDVETRLGHPVASVVLEAAAELRAANDELQRLALKLDRALAGPEGVASGNAED